MSTEKDPAPLTPYDFGRPVIHYKELDRFIEHHIGKGYQSLRGAEDHWHNEGLYRMGWEGGDDEEEPRLAEMDIEEVEEWLAKPEVLPAYKAREFPSPYLMMAYLREVKKVAMPPLMMIYVWW